MTAQAVVDLADFHWIDPAGGMRTHQGPETDRRLNGNWGRRERTGYRMAVAFVRVEKGAGGAGVAGGCVWGRRK